MAPDVVGKFAPGYLEGLYRSLSLSQLLFGWFMLLAILASVYHFCRSLWYMKKGSSTRLVFLCTLWSIRSLLVAGALGLLHIVMFCE